MELIKEIKCFIYNSFILRQKEMDMLYISNVHLFKRWKVYYSQGGRIIVLYYIVKGELLYYIILL